MGVVYARVLRLGFVNGIEERKLALRRILVVNARYDQSRYCGPHGVVNRSRVLCKLLLVRRMKGKSMLVEECVACAAGTERVLMRLIGAEEAVTCRRTLNV
jgi:hypothetical protein